MNGFASLLPIFPTDAEPSKELGKKLALRIREVANLGTDIPQLNRNSDQLLAAGRRSTTMPPELDRKKSVKMLEATLEHALSSIVEKNPDALRAEQLLAIKNALPALAEEFSEDLKQFRADEYTFERNILDPVLRRNGAPAFEIAIATDHKHAFDFDAARRTLLARAGGKNAQAVRDISQADVRTVLKSSIRPLVDIIVERKLLPPNHRPVVLTDDSKQVVGLTFQHTKHQGIVPMCAESVERFNMLRARLFGPGQAQMFQLPSDHLMDPSDNISPITSAWGSDRPPGPEAFYAEIELAEAIDYLRALEAAINGERIACLAHHVPSLRRLNGASLLAHDIISVGTKTTRRRWGLHTYPGERGRGKVISASGVQGGMMGPQWYLRQIEWLDEEAVPELGMPSAHFLAKPEQHPFVVNNDASKIIPDTIRDFFNRARSHVDKMALERSNSVAVQQAVKKLRDQDRQLRAIDAALQQDAALREEAVEARLAGFIGKVPPPVSETPLGDSAATSR